MYEVLFFVFMTLVFLKIGVLLDSSFVDAFFFMS